MLSPASEALTCSAIVEVLHAMANTADMLIPLAADQLLVDGSISDPAIGIVTDVHLVVYLLLALAIIG